MSDHGLYETYCWLERLVHSDRDMQHSVILAGIPPVILVLGNLTLSVSQCFTMFWLPLISDDIDVDYQYPLEVRSGSAGSTEGILKAWCGWLSA